MKFKDFIKEEYHSSHRVGGTTVELHKNPLKSDFKLPTGHWELKGWLDATTDTLYVFLPAIGHWLDASDYEHEQLITKVHIPLKNKIIPIYLAPNSVDVGEWSLGVALRYAKGYDKIYQDELYKNGYEKAMDKVSKLAKRAVLDSKRLFKFYGKSYTVGSF